MIGVGRIFEAYRDGSVDAEDEVALVYDRETYEPLSDPLINIRFALEDAVRGGLIERARAKDAVEKAKKMWFPLRSYAGLSRLFPELAALFSGGLPNQKAADAISMLRSIGLARNA
jgi:hypothetical protein